MKKDLVTTAKLEMSAWTPDPRKVGLPRARVTLVAQQLCLPATTSSPVGPGPAWASDTRTVGS